MKKFVFLPVALLTCIAFQLPAQKPKDPVLLTIASKDITRTEFEKIYHKNNNKDNSSDAKSIEDYLDLFINYKLKVKEAEELHLDTTKTFKTELTGYRKQLAQPYLIDKETSDLLVKEAYERIKTDVRASHILIKVGPDASPADTLKAYKRSVKIREMISKGADFSKVARDSSEDPSAKDNAGDLGYFTVLQMVYPFENAAYSAKVGDVSNPVRTRFGYHLIKVTDKRSDPGEVSVAHIMVKCNTKADKEETLTAKAKIDSLYNLLKQGANFEELAKSSSEDQGSAKSGGSLPPFTTGRMVPEFEKAAFELKNKGDYSAPIKTAYGWHIVKLISSKPLAGFTEMQADLKSRVSKDSRAELSKIQMVAKVKAAYHFQDFPKAKDEMLKLADSTLAEGTWSVQKAAGMKNPMFNLLDNSFTQSDFANYVAEKQVAKKGSIPAQLMSALYDQFVEETVLNMKENRLESEFPEYKALMEEYRDGILLFELTDQKVWTKAVKDSAGLKTYYEANNTKYMWGDRLAATIYTCLSEEIANKAKKMSKKKNGREVIEQELNKENPKNIQIKEGVFSRGDNELIDKVKWSKGVYDLDETPGHVIFVNVREVLSPSPKLLDEARGIITSDYQQKLEKDWVETLRKKYPVVINKEVLTTVK